MSIAFDSRKLQRKPYLSPEAQAYKSGDLIYFCVKHHGKNGQLLRFAGLVIRPLEVNVLISYERADVSYIQAVKPERLERR